ncbi:MAG: hypothetical protein ACK46L_08700 [Synechococcaceae cyanobacterium]
MQLLLPVFAIALCRVRELRRWHADGVAEFSRLGLLGVGVLGLGVLGLGLLGAAAPARAQLLYRLETRCSLAGGALQPCVVEASKDGDSTIYHHTIGRRIETIRFSEAPLRVSRRQLSTSQWQPVRLASLRFLTNTVCFDGRMLCVINPKQLERLRQGNPLQLDGRDLVRVHFGRDGRIDARCFDEGCEVSFQ